MIRFLCNSENTERVQTCLKLEIVLSIPIQFKLSSFRFCGWKSVLLFISQNPNQSTYAKVHGSVGVAALQRKEAEESACGKVHDPAFKITVINFQEKLLCNLLVKNGNY